MYCGSFMDERIRLWDDISNIISVQAEADLFSLSDDDIVYIMLGKEWRHLRDKEILCKFYCKVAIFANNILNKCERTGITINSLFSRIITT